MRLIRRVDWLKTVGSTNDYLKQFVDLGHPHAAVAGSQSQGKGRHGRSWHSLEGEGLYTSILIFPELPSKRAQLLNAISVLAIVASIRELIGDTASPTALGIKPPNDVLLNGKKIAGVLVETASLGESIQWAVVGMGVNLSQESFPPADYRVTPTSLRMEGLKSESAEAFYYRLERQFESLYRKASSGFAAQIQEEYDQAVLESQEGRS